MRANLKDSYLFYSQQVGKTRMWLFMLLIAIINLLPFGNYISNFLLLGHKIEVIKSSMNNEDSLPLLNFDNLLDKFVRGAKFFVVKLIYSIPVTVIFMIPFFILFIPFYFTAGESGPENILLLLSFILVFILIGILGMLWNSWVVLPATYLYQNQEKIEDAFKFPKLKEIIFSNKKQLSYHFINLLLYQFVYFIALVSALFLIMFCVGIFLVIPILIFGNIFNFIILPHYEGKIFGEWEKKHSY